MKLAFKVKKVVDNATTGAAARKRRKCKKLSLRAVAARMDVSPPYLSDLELGRRNWSAETLAAFEAATTKGNGK